MYHKTKPVTKATTPSIAISLFIYYSVLFKSYKFLYCTHRTHEQASRKGQFTQFTHRTHEQASRKGQFMHSLHTVHMNKPQERVSLR